MLFSLHFSTVADANFQSEVRQISDTFVPLKIVLFKWKLLQDIHSIRIELWRRDVTRDVHQQCCILCFDEIELASHLFVNYRKTRQICELIFKWLDWRADSWSNVLVHNFLLFNSLCKGKKGRKASHLIWI